MIKPNIDDFDSNIAYLNAYFQFRRAIGRRFTLRQWAQELGYNHPGYISNLLKGARRINSEFIERFARSGSLSDEERNQMTLRSLVERAAVNPGLRKEIETRLGMTASDPARLDEEKFRLIRDWYHLAILELVEIEGFRWDYDWIARKLGLRISTLEAEMAVKRLLKLGLLTDRDGGLRKTNAAIQVESEQASDAIKSYHLQALRMATEALATLPLEKREFASTVLAVRAEDLPGLAQSVRDFNRSLHVLADQAVASNGRKPEILVRINTNMFTFTDP